MKTNVLLTKSSCFIKFYNQRNEAHSTLYSIVVSSSMCSTFQSYTKKTESMKRKYILFILKSFGIWCSVDLYQNTFPNKYCKKYVMKKSRKHKLTYCFKKFKNNNNFFLHMSASQQQIVYNR